MLGKLKKSVAGASAKIKAAGSDLIDNTSMKLAGKVFRVNNKRYKARRLIAEGTSEGRKMTFFKFHVPLYLLPFHFPNYLCKASYTM